MAMKGDAGPMAVTNAVTPGATGSGEDGAGTVAKRVAKAVAIMAG